MGVVRQILRDENKENSALSSDRGPLRGYSIT